MVRPAARFRPFFLAVSLVLVASCTGDEQGVRRLPLEPDASLGLLTVSPNTSSLGWIGATARLTAQITGGDGAAVKGFNYTWRSLDAGVLTVDGTGRITALTEGAARVVVTTLNLADTALVTVERTPSAIDLTADSLLFTTLGAQTTIASTVLDGGGVALSGSTVTWFTSDTTVATVSQSGVVVAVGQGRANLTARAGAVAKAVKVRVSVGTASVSVAPASVTFDALGDSVQLVPTVKDAAGNTLTGVPVTYGVTNTTVATVSAEGVVRGWKVGNTQVVAYADSVSRVVGVSVTQTVSTVTVSPDSTTIIPGASVTLTALAADRNGYPIPSAIITWTSSDPALVTVNNSGRVTAQGPEGTATVSATSGGVTGEATVTVVDIPVATVDVDPSALDLAQGASAALSVTLRSAEGMILVGPTVTWSSDNLAVAQVDAQGLVTGISEGTTWVHATVLDSLAATDSASVTVTSTPSEFDIDVRYLGPTPTANQLAAFGAAKARWQEVILGDLPGLPVNATSICGQAGADLNETVDDLVIFARVDSIDGPGGILGQAGPCLVRTSGGLAVVGTMQFDDADLADLEASGDLVAVIIHEMGHVLGFGSVEPWTDLLVGAGTEDPYWPGAAAVQWYNAAGGSAINKVPIANTGGEGTRDAHWREASMGAELMTGYINSGSTNPLSAISIGAMQDIGYVVDFNAAHPYTVTPGFRAPGRLIELRELVLAPPLLITPQGRILGAAFRLR